MPLAGRQPEVLAHGRPQSALLHGVHELYSLNVSAIDANTPPIAIPRCIVCESQSALPRYKIEDSGFSIVKCTSCGVGFLWPPPAPEQIRAFYPANYYGDDGFKFSATIEPLVRFIGIRSAWFIAKLAGRGARILDVGCGRGVTLRSLADFGCETHGFEVSSTAVQGIDARVVVTVAPCLAEAGYPENNFDGVLIWHVLEHVPTPRETLREAWRILKPGGVLVVAVPNFSSIQAKWAGAAWFHLDAPRHLFHFSVSALEDLLRSTGFVLESRHHFSLRQNPFGWIQSAQNKLPWLPRNGLYAMLHHRRSRGAVPFGMRTRLQLWLCFAVLAGPAVLLSVLAAILRSGATIHIVARKQGH